LPFLDWQFRDYPTVTEFNGIGERNNVILHSDGGAARDRRATAETFAL
jgi:hypothetical protein